MLHPVYRGMLGRREYQNMVKKKNKYDEQRSLFLSQVFLNFIHTGPQSVLPRILKRPCMPESKYSYLNRSARINLLLGCHWNIKISRSSSTSNIRRSEKTEAN